MWVLYMFSYLVLSWVVLSIIALYEKGRIKWVITLAEQVWGTIYCLFDKFRTLINKNLLR